MRFLFILLTLQLSEQKRLVDASIKSELILDS